MKANSKFQLFFPCYFSFLVNGAMVLLVGAILPYVIEEAKISYSVAGGLLSAFAIGNLLASFVNPVLVSKIGRKAATVSMCSLIPIMLFVVTLLPPVPVLYAAFILIGIGRGSVSIINNAVVNDNSDGKPAMLNLLHMTFAVGAFISPFLTSVCMNNGWGWRTATYIIIAGSTLATVFYGLMKLDYNWPKDSKKNLGKGGEIQAQTQIPFYKSPVFYVMGILLFLYLGLENCVNGWFVTYFKNMGIMSATYASGLVSITWIMVMLGRLLTAKLSAFIDKNKLVFAYCVATAVFFVLLISTKNLAVITVAIAGMGFFFAGIYPTTVSSAGAVLKGTNTGMAMFLAIAALGGIVTPQIVGVIADSAGMVAAIVVLTFNVVGMFITALLNIKINKKTDEN